MLQGAPLSDATAELQELTAEHTTTETPIIPFHPFSSSDTKFLSTPPPTPSPLGDITEKSNLSDDDLQLDTDVMEFVKNAYRQSRGAKISNAELKRYADKIREGERAASPEEFRQCLWNFLNTTSEWLREHKWPLPVFLKEPTRYTPPVPAYRPPASTPPAPSRASASSEPAANAPGSITETSKPDYLTYVDRWNSINIERPADNPLLSTTRRLLEEAIKQPDFVNHFDDICEGCRKLIASGEKTKFAWLFQTGRGIVNWDGLLQGKFDFLMKEPQMDAFERLLAKAEREEREKQTV